MISLGRYFKRVSDIDTRSAAARLEDLLNASDTLEGDLQKFLSENAYILPQLAPRRSLFVVNQARLDDKYVVDFALYGEANINWWTLIEIERPTARLFTKSGDPARDFTHALQQTYDWQRWKESSFTWSSVFGDGAPPHLDTVLVIGRRTSLNQETTERLKGYGLVYTYDSLLEMARTCSNLKPDAVVQSDAIPWADFKKILKTKALGSLWREIERITGTQVYARVADFSGEISEYDIMSTLRGEQMVDSAAAVSEVIEICERYAQGAHISAPQDPVLAQLVAFLYELKTIQWGSATQVPKKEVAIYQKVFEGWGRMADWRCSELLEEALVKRFGSRKEDVVNSVSQAVSSVKVWHYEGVRTCEHYALSILVPGWCEPDRNIYATEMGLLRAGGQVASNLLINNERVLAVLW